MQVAPFSSKIPFWDKTAEFCWRVLQKPVLKWLQQTIKVSQICSNTKITVYYTKTLSKSLDVKGGTYGLKKAREQPVSRLRTIEAALNWEKFRLLLELNWLGTSTHWFPVCIGKQILCRHPLGWCERQVLLLSRHQ